MKLTLLIIFLSQSAFTQQADSLFNLGSQRFKAHRYIDAAGNFNDAMIAGYNKSKCLEWIGYCYDKEGEGEKARKCYIKSLETYRDANGYLRGTIEYKAGYNRESLCTLFKWIQENPLDRKVTPSHIWISLNYRDLNKMDSALYYGHLAVSAESEFDTWALLTQGENYHTINDYTTALKLYQRAMDVAVNQGHSINMFKVKNRIGESLLAQGKISEAIAHLLEVKNLGYLNYSLQNENRNLLSLAYQMDVDQQKAIGQRVWWLELKTHAIALALALLIIFTMWFYYRQRSINQQLFRRTSRDYVKLIIDCLNTSQAGSRKKAKMIAQELHRNLN